MVSRSLDAMTFHGVIEVTLWVDRIYLRLQGGEKISHS